MKVTQASFEQLGRNQEQMFKTQAEMIRSQETTSKNTKASIKHLANYLNR